MKKFISLILVVIFLITPFGCGLFAFASYSVSVDSFIDSVLKLNEEELQLKKTEEDSAGSRVIVKALQKPPVFGEAEYIKGTYGKHIFQYATEEEANDAVEFYHSLPFVSYAVIDAPVWSSEVPYAEAMLGTQRALEYITNQEIPTSGVKVAVIDSGIEFSNEVFKDNPRIIDSGVNVTDTGYKNHAIDDKGHGSLCAEIIMDNTGTDVSVIGYKALNKNGIGTELWIATAIEKAIEDGVDIINLSLGGEAEPVGYESSVVMDDAVRLAMSQGILVVAASGNEGLNAEHFSPANIEGVITVGAIDKAGNRAYFSNYGEDVDFVAPGVELEHDYMREYVDADGIHHKGFTEPIDGTSFACPYVVAEIATLLSVYPGLSREEVVGKLAAASVSYEHLTYHDGFHPIFEDQIIVRNGTPYYWNEWYEKEVPFNLRGGLGMPQIDLVFNDYERETTPAFSLDSGHFIDEELDLYLTSSSDAEIYYTKDESYPTKENGIQYEGKIHLDELQSIRAVAFSDNKAPSYFDAREYFFEYHISESELVANQYRKNRIEGYTGTRNNIILPATKNGVTITHVGFFETPNANISSIKMPDTVVSGGGVSINCSQNLVILDAIGLERISFNGTYYPSLVKVNMPNVISIHFNDCFIRELNVENPQQLECNGCRCLKKVTSKGLKMLEGRYFQDCYSLEEIDMPSLTGIGECGFMNCFKLSKYTFENIEEMGRNALGGCMMVEELYCPNLTKLYYTDHFTGSGLRYLYAPLLEKLPTMFGCYNYGWTSKLIVSSKFIECADAEVDISDASGETYHRKYFLEIYGTPNTYAEEYANQFDLKFVELPLLESEPEDMGHQSDGNITTDVLGFNKEYQWYGTNIKDNRLGTILEGETYETVDTSKYDYNYYYCVVKTHDGEYKKDVITGTRKTLDMNGDSIIDIADLSVLLYYYGTAPEKDIYDVNEDGIIDIQDIQYLLFSTVFGTKE